MSILEANKPKVRSEQRQQEAFSITDLSALLAEERMQELLARLPFFTSPTDLGSYLETAYMRIRSRFEEEGSNSQASHIRFLAGLALALRSSLPRWNLQNTQRHAHEALTNVQVAVEADRAHALAVELAARAPVAAEVLFNQWRADATARLRAARADDPGKERDC